MKQRTRVTAQRPKAYSYLRFSTPEQSKGDSQRRQTKLAEDYAKKHALDLDESLTFHDLGVSAYHGANAETGRLGDFLEAVRVGLVEQGSYLLVESLDRISRKVARKAVRILEQICDAGITLVTLTDGHQHNSESLDNDPMSFLMAFLVFVRSNEESATKGHRLREAWDRKRAVAADTPLTSACPGWLHLDRAAGKFIVNTERADIVRRIFAETLQGCSPHSIALALNVECVPVFGRGTQWHRSYIVKLLDSPAVVGRMIPHTTEYKDGKRRRKAQTALDGYFPSIITEQMYQRVTSLRLSANSPMRGKHAGKEVQNIFGGLARCARCGGTMTRVNKGTEGDRQWHYLVCVAGKTGAGCVYQALPYGEIESAFINDLDRLIDTVPVADKVKGRAIAKQIRDAEASLEGLSDAMDNLLDTASTTPTVTLTRRIRELKGEQDRVEGLLSELAERRAETSGALVRSKLTDLRQTVDNTPLDRTRLNTILRQALSSVVVDGEEGQLVIHWKHGGESEVTYRLDAAHYGFTRGSLVVAPKRVKRVTKGMRMPTSRETR